MNATGLRDQRVKLYKRVDTGSDGFVNEAFYLLYERWARLESTRSNAGISGERVQTKTDAVAEFADEVEIPVNGVALDVASGQAWWIRGINSVRALRRTVVGLDRITDEEFRQYKFFDSPSDAGTRLVDPA